MATKHGIRAKGKLSDELIHRIDTMNDEDDLESKPYVARKKTELDTEQLFDSHLYMTAEEINDMDEENGTLEKTPKGPTIAIAASVVILVGVIVFVLMNVL